MNGTNCEHNFPRGVKNTIANEKTRVFIVERRRFLEQIQIMSGEKNELGLDFHAYLIVRRVRF